MSADTRPTKRKRPPSTVPEPALERGCAGVLDARDLGVLNTTLRAKGVSDHDRHEVLKAASLLAANECAARRSS